MVEILNEVFEKKATMIPVPKERPNVIGAPGDEVINFNYVRVPYALNRRLLKHCKVNIERDIAGLTSSEVEERIRDTNKEKDLYIRFAHDIPLSVVTDKFKEIKPSELASKAASIMGAGPKIRYFKNNQSLQFNFPLDTRFDGMHAVISTGPYGVFGGSGINAVTYGIAWYNATCANWTIFLEKTLQQGAGKIIHTKGNGLEEKLTNLLSLTDAVEGKINQSQYQTFTPSELNSYLAMYQTKGLNKKIADQIRAEHPKGMNVFDLSYILTELCQDKKLSDTTRARIEYMAGEVILCADEIKEKLSGDNQCTNRESRQIIISPMPRQYISQD